MVAGTLVAAIAGGVGLIGSVFDAVSDRIPGIGSGSEGGCVPSLGDGQAQDAAPTVSPSAVDPSLPPRATSVRTVRFEVTGADATSARVSVYGDTPETRSCDVALPWAAEAQVEDAGVVYVTSAAPEPGGAVACRIYFDGVLVSEALMGERGTYCVGRVANWIGGEADRDGSTGDLVAVPATGPAAAALPTDAGLELQVEAATASTVDVSVLADSEDPVDTDDVPVPAQLPVAVPASAERVRIYAANYRDEGLVRCRLSVGGVPVSMQLSLGYASCETSLLDLGLR